MIELIRAYPELLWFAEMLVCFSAVVLVCRWFGIFGIYVYGVIAVVMANVQILKVVKFDLYHYPIPLGTILFTSTFLVTDILVEFFGVKAARRGIMLGFLGFGLWTLFSTLTLNYPVQTVNQTVSGAMQVLLSPSWRLFIAGMTAYLTSQMLNIYVFDWFKRKTGDKYLWLRNTFSTLLATLIDNIIFSLMAWVILAEHPVSWSVLVGTYIIGTYWFRVIVAIIDTPFIYLVKHFAFKGRKVAHCLID